MLEICVLRVFTDRVFRRILNYSKSKMSGEPEEVAVEEHQDGEVSCNLEKIYLNFKNGLCGEEDVDMSCYLSAYKELYNFFVLLGGAFQFIATDVKTKIKILEDLQVNEKETKEGVANFSSVKKMILHEKGEKLLENDKYVSGSRTLLRLHRGLDFVRHFFKEIYDIEENVKISNICRETYDKTLAQYHTWVVRNSARLAMKLLPTKAALLKKMSKDNSDTDSILKVMPELLEMMKVTYERVQKLYSEHELLDLP